MSISSEAALENAGGTRSVPVWAHVTPETVDEVRDAIRRSAGLLSISGARYSPDTQYAQPGALHLDLASLNRVVRLEPIALRVTVQAGIRWFDLLRFLQPHALSVRVMPPFANFTVGGSISANQASPYLRCGPVSQGVTALTMVMADGAIRTIRPETDGDLFRAVAGGFGGFGVIVEAELELTPNTPLLRRSHAMTADLYPDFFRSRIQTDAGARIHSAEFEAPGFERLRAVTWVETRDAPTHQQPLHYPGMVDPLRKVLDWSQPATGLSRLYRRSVVEPLAAARRTVHWRNYEASHDLQAFDPKIYQEPQFEFHDFAVTLARFGDFHGAIRAIVARYQVPAVRLRVTQYGPASRSLLALADGDGAFHFRLVTRALRPSRGGNHDGDVWVRELTQAAIDCGGRFDPSFRMVATREQFEQAFPNHDTLLRIKREVDPFDRFGNGFWRHFHDLPSADPVTVMLPLDESHGAADTAIWIPTAAAPNGSAAAPASADVAGNAAAAATHATAAVQATHAAHATHAMHATQATQAAQAARRRAAGERSSRKASDVFGVKETRARPLAKAPARVGTAASVADAAAPKSEFATIWSQPVPRDNLYRMLRELAPGNKATRLFQLVARQIERNDDDELIYRNLRRSLMKWRQNWHAALTMRRANWMQPLQKRLLAFTAGRLVEMPEYDGGRLDGVAEIGSMGLHLAALRQSHRLTGPMIVLDEKGRPLSSGSRRSGDGGRAGLAGLLGRRGETGANVDARVAIPARALAPAGSDDGLSPLGAEESLDLVTIYAGLRGLSDATLPALLDDIMEALRPGGLVLVLDHDADGAHMALEASVAVRLAALCEMQTWEQSEEWPRNFRAADDWAREFCDAGFEEIGGREKVSRSPWGNLLTAFQKPLEPAAG